MAQTIFEQFAKSHYDRETLGLANIGQQTWQYLAIATIAAETGILENHETDLTIIDAAMIAVHNPDSFVWCVRTSGTHLHYINTDSDREWRRAEVKNFTHNDRRFYAISRRGVVELTPERYEGYMV